MKLGWLTRGRWRCQRVGNLTHFQKWCKEDEFCDEMISQSDCIQFYVKSDDKFFILHEDEIDITGMCQDQVHCSGILSEIYSIHLNPY